MNKGTTALVILLNFFLCKFCNILTRVISESKISVGINIYMYDVVYRNILDENL